MAVDYVKSGVPARMPRELRVRRWPHFMEKNHVGKEQIYVSGKVLGQLYDQVERVDFVPQFENPFDERILQAYHLDDEIMMAASQIKEEYDAAIRRIMAQHEIQTEFEVWSTFVLSHSGQSKDYKFHEEIGQISGALKDRFCEVCREKAGGKEFEKLGPFVAAMYTVTQEEMAHAVSQCHQKKVVGGREVPVRKMDIKSMPLMSFPWLFPGMLGKIANGGRRAEDGDSTNAVSAAESQRRRLRRLAAAGRSKSEDLIETVEGVTHRGEILELFHHGDESEPSPPSSHQAGESRQVGGSEELGADLSWDSPLGEDALSMYQPERPIQRWAGPDQLHDADLYDGLSQLDDEEYHAEDEQDRSDERQGYEAVREPADDDFLLIDLGAEESSSNVNARVMELPSKIATTGFTSANNNTKTDIKADNPSVKRLTDSDASESDTIHFTPQRSDGEDDFQLISDQEPSVNVQKKPLTTAADPLDFDEESGSSDEEAITLDVHTGKSALEALADLSFD